MMKENMPKPQYEKPVARSLGAVAAAEGFCLSGGTASLTTCTSGVATYFCSGGGTPTDNTRPQVCNIGPVAANCFSGTDAGG